VKHETADQFGCSMVGASSAQRITGFYGCTPILLGASATFSRSDAFSPRILALVIWVPILSR